MSDPEPTTPRPLSDEEIEQRLAELEASMAEETPPAASMLRAPAATDEDRDDEPLTTTEQLLASPGSSASAGFGADTARPARSVSFSRARVNPSGSEGAAGGQAAAAKVSEAIGTSQIVERAIGVSRFAQKYYRDVAGDPGATTGAAIVVVVVAVATGLGGIGAGIGGFLAGLLWAVIRWLLFTAAAWFLAREVFKTKPEGTITSLARVTGYAQAPGIIAIVGFIPLLGWSLSLVGNIWLVLAVVMGLRYVLKLDFKQSFLTAIGAWLVAGALAALIAVVFGVDLATVF